MVRAQMRCSCLEPHLINRIGVPLLSLLPDSFRYLVIQNTLPKRRLTDKHKPTYGDQPVCAYAMVGPNAKVSSYLAGAASSDNTLPRYNVNTFLNSATTRTFPLGSASP